MMCGIVASVGKRDCKKRIIEGLRVLEYRGYDSSGFACINKKTQRIDLVKAAGGLDVLMGQLEQYLGDGAIGIGHTRWATHGGATNENAHPHVNNDCSVAVVHNGILEESAQLRLRLQAQGHLITSETDTELVAHLFSDLLSEYDHLHDAIHALQAQLKGSYALVLIAEQYPDQLIVLRKKSPLAIGFAAEYTMVASDQLAFDAEVHEILYIPDECYGVVSAQSFLLFDQAGVRQYGEKIARSSEHFSIDKGEFSHHMLKEMYEQKDAIVASIKQYQKQDAQEVLWSRLGLTSERIQWLESIYIIAAGSSWHAGRISQFFFEEVCELPVRVYIASEFNYMPFFPDRRGLYLFISQSGETADTLEALRMVQRYGVKTTLAITNVATSSLAREAQGCMLMHAGPEIAVASTKAFSCQVATLYWLAHRIALERGVCDESQLAQAERDLTSAAEQLEEGLRRYHLEMEYTHASHYARYDRMIFLGRHIMYPFALEASLKLKEISYIFAQCYPAGELKHGPIALVDYKTPIMLFSVQDDLLYQKTLANAQEVKARGGHLIICGFQGQQELLSLADTAFIMPSVPPLLAPLAFAGIIQLFAYTITCQLGHAVDRPRNLAKSVTVE